MTSNTGQDGAPDLIESIDSLLSQVEATTKAYTPEMEQAINANALLTDDGTVAAPPEPEPVAEDSTDPAEDSSETIDSIENAQQALDAVEAVESQAEELVEQSIDSLLNDMDSLESDEIAEAADEEEIEPEIQPEVESVSDLIPESAVAEVSEPTSEELSEDLLGSAIDDLLEREDSEKTTVEDEIAGDDTAIDDAVEKLVVEETEAVTPEEVVEESIEDPAQDIAEQIVEESVEEPIEDSAVETAEEAVEEAVDPKPAPDPIVATSVDDLISETSGASSEALQTTMDTLDDALAAAADDMLDGDFETEEGDLVTGEAVASAIEEALVAEDIEAESAAEPAQDKDDSSLLDRAADELLTESNQLDDNSDEQIQSAEPVNTPDPEQAVVAEGTSEPSPAPAGKSAAGAPVVDERPDAADAEIEELELQAALAVPAWFERGIEIIRPRIDKIDPLKGKTMDAIATVLGTVIVAAMNHATPIVAKIVVLVSKPLAKQSPEIRNAVGYIALWTGFLAMVLWVYLLMFRSTPVPQPEAAPSRVINADEALVVQPVVEVLP